MNLIESKYGWDMYGDIVLDPETNTTTDIRILKHKGFGMEISYNHDLFMDLLPHQWGDNENVNHILMTFIMKINALYNAHIEVQQLSENGNLMKIVDIMASAEYQELTQTEKDRLRDDVGVMVDFLEANPHFMNNNGVCSGTED